VLYQQVLSSLLGRVAYVVSDKPDLWADNQHQKKKNILVLLYFQEGYELNRIIGSRRRNLVIFLVLGNSQPDN
jgi:hypothetical protein